MRISELTINQLKINLERVSEYVWKTDSFNTLPIAEQLLWKSLEKSYRNQVSMLEQLLARQENRDRQLTDR